MVCQNEHIHTCLSILMWYTLSLYEMVINNLHSHAHTLVFVQGPIVIVLYNFSAHGTYELHSRNMINPSGLSDKFFHEFPVCSFIMGTSDILNISQREEEFHMIMRSFSLMWQHSRWWLFVCVLQSVQTGPSHKTPTCECKCPSFHQSSHYYQAVEFLCKSPSTVLHFHCTQCYALPFKDHSCSPWLHQNQQPSYFSMWNW